MQDMGPLRPDGGSRTVRAPYNRNAVGPDYFRIMGIPLLEGRAFTDADRAGTPDIVILNQNLARRLFGNTDPVGHILGFADQRDARVVGVARNSKYATLGEANAMALYAPYSQQRADTFAHFFVRVRGAPEGMVRTVDETLGNLDPGFAVETWAMSHIFSGALMPSRVGAGILGSMALFGLVLASIGLYGVLLYAIHQRTREIGIRVALGATPGNVLGMVGGQSFRLVAAGVAIGLALAVAAVRPLSMFLVPEVRPADPMNFAMVAGALAVVAGLATVAPTVRALRVDPAAALRHE
jgi:putative ABC transport system permease protein